MHDAQQGSSQELAEGMKPLRLKAVQKMAQEVLHIEGPPSRAEDGVVCQLLGHAMRLRQVPFFESEFGIRVTLDLLIQQMHAASALTKHDCRTMAKHS